MSTTCGLCGGAVPPGWMLCGHCADKMSQLKAKPSAAQQVQAASPRYTQQWYFPSASDPERKYKVSQKQDGTFECDCPAWKFRLKKQYAVPYSAKMYTIPQRKDCKHIAQVRAELAMQDTPTPTEPPPPAVKRRRFNFDD